MVGIFDDEHRGTNSILASCRSCTKTAPQWHPNGFVFFSELEWFWVRNNICLVIWMVMVYYINQLKYEWVWFSNIKHIWETLEVLNASFSVALLLHRKNIGHNISNNTSIWDVSDDLFGGKRNQISWRFKQMSCKTSAKYSIDAEFLPVLQFFTLFDPLYTLFDFFGLLFFVGVFWQIGQKKLFQSNHQILHVQHVGAKWPQNPCEMHYSVTCAILLRCSIESAPIGSSLFSKVSTMELNFTSANGEINDGLFNCNGWILKG